MVEDARAFAARALEAFGNELTFSFDMTKLESFDPKELERAFEDLGCLTIRGESVLTVTPAPPSLRPKLPSEQKG